MAFVRTFLMYGGARGGGKSYWLRRTMVGLLLYWYYALGLKHVRAGLFCETYPDLEDRQISKIVTEFPPSLGEVKDTKAHGLGFHLRPKWGGGVLALRNLDDPSKYQSAEFAAIGIDQAEKNELAKFNVLRGSLRWPGVEHNPMLLTANPGGIGGAWVRQYFIDRQYPPELMSMAAQFAFVQAFPSDNPYLPASYWAQLNSLPPDLYAAWVEGKWDVFEGQAFGQFDRVKGTCKPFEIPAHWRIWRAVDWGFTAPFCCLWFAKDPSTKRIYVFRELYAASLTDMAQAQAIVEYSRERLTDATWADPSMWKVKNQDGVVTTTVDEYAACGVALVKASNDRYDGKRKVDRALMPMADGRPGLIIFETCHNLIRTLPTLVYDKTHPEDVDTRGEDHAYDALRYGLSQELTPGMTPQQLLEQRQKQSVHPLTRSKIL